jgi:hypothetical protein
VPFSRLRRPREVRGNARVSDTGWFTPLAGAAPSRETRHYALVRRAHVLLGLLVLVGCDPGVAASVTNRCDKSVWMRVERTKDRLTSATPKEVQPGKSVKLGALAESGVLAISATPESVGTVQPLTNRTTHVEVSGSTCPA